MHNNNETYEIIAFSDMEPSSKKVIIIIAAGLSLEEIKDFKIQRIQNQFEVNLNNGEQIHIGTCDNPNQFNWTKAILGIMDDELILHYTNEVAI
jgi:hypothetical protein